MRYVKFDFSEMEEMHLYPFVCWHIGSPQSDEKFIKQMIDRVKKDKLAKWVYMGDGGENAIMGSKGDPYSQTMSPQEQVNTLADLLEPIAEKGLFAIKGNHGHRTYKNTGMEPDENLARILRLPYLGTAAFSRIIVGESNYDVYFHHGGDSGVSVASKVNAAKKPESYVNADAIITAHSHIAMDLPPSYSARINASKNEPIDWLTTFGFVVGSAYDSRTGYAEDKLYPPIIPSHYMLNFSGKLVSVNGHGRPEKKITSTIYRADANSNPRMHGL